jgi:hypothetical protein
VRVVGSLTDAHWRAISSAKLRAFVPQSMNVELTPAGGFNRALPTVARSLSQGVELQPALFD